MENIVKNMSILSERQTYHNNCDNIIMIVCMNVLV